MALDLPLAREFDYLSPDAEPDDVGRRVTVPFGNKRLIGILVALSDRSDVSLTKLKAIETIHRETPALDAATLSFLRFCARYYHHPFGQVLLHALPPGLRKPQIWKPRATARRKAAPAARMLDDGTTWVPHPLSPAQSAAVEALARDISAPRFATWLLHGVTGSGKTEVYLALAERVISAGRKALILVPEINLTPQLEARVRAHFPATPVVSLHSQLAGSARVLNWLQAGEDRAMVIIGTRLAILGPLPRLGLIVVDEEHDASYKQQEGLRYSARDMAVVRGRDAGCPVLLGSATPSLESLAQVERARYGLLSLPHRADPRASLPAISLIDLRVWPAEDGLSVPALGALQAACARGEQALVFINRRGFAPALWCAGCGWTAGCPRCSAHLVVHLRARQARCHLCGWQQAIPRHCPTCGNSELRPAGEGTQKLEGHLRRAFPTARILRVDADTMAGKGQFDQLRQTVLAGEVDIVVGTQMLTKGHDFPALTCVVVVNSDGALFSADFRAAERLFAQLLQVAGRAGRADRAGTVLIQTAQPEHPLFQAVLKQDYLHYARDLLEERGSAGFPPETHQAVLHASGPQAQAVEQFLVRARSLLPAPAEVEIYDPIPASVARVAHKFRYQLLVQSPNRGQLQGFLGQWMGLLRSQSSGSVLWVLDVDPLDV